MKRKTPEIKTRTDGSEYISMKDDVNGHYLSYLEVSYLLDEPDADTVYTAEEIDDLLLRLNPALESAKKMTTWKSMRLKNLESEASVVLLKPLRYEPSDVLMLRSILAYLNKHHRLPIVS